MRIVSRAFKDKIEELISEKPKEQRKEEQASILKYVLDVMFDGIYEKIKGQNLGHAGVKIFLKLLQDILLGYKGLKDQSFTQAVELSAVVFAQNLLDITRPEEYVKEFEQLIYNLVYKTLGVKTPNYKQFIRNDLPNGRFMILGKCLDLDAKSEIISELSSNLETLALNDKEVYGHASKNLMFFSTFLGNASKEVVIDKVLPQC